MTDVYIVNAFTANGEHGNPAGVVLDATHLDETDMKHIAREVNLFETAFVREVDETNTPVAILCT